MKKILLSALVLGFVSCNQQSEVASLQGGSGTCSGDIAKTSSNGPLFKVGDTTITRDDLPSDIKHYIYKNEKEAYDKNVAILKEMSLRIYLAKKQGNYKADGKLPEIQDLLSYQKATEEEAKAFYEQNKFRMQGASYETVKPQVFRYIEGQRISQAFQVKFAELEKSGEYTNMLAAPVAPKVNFDTTGLPTMGNKNSKVKIIEVSDYLCGHCQRAHPAVKEILKKYKDKISFTQVNFSLRPSGLSGTYIRGAFCAQKQSEDKFWKYHDAAFKQASAPHDHSAPGHSHGEDGSSKESMDKVMAVAKEAGLNEANFKKCLESDASKANLMKVNNMVVSNGINGTPVFIINNEKLESGVSGLEQAISKALK
jgi:protein-disulfide isomerase